MTTSEMIRRIRMQRKILNRMKAHRIAAEVSQVGNHFVLTAEAFYSEVSTALQGLISVSGIKVLGPGSINKRSAVRYNIKV